MISWWTDGSCYIRFTDSEARPCGDSMNVNLITVQNRQRDSLTDDFADVKFKESADAVEFHSLWHSKGTMVSFGQICLCVIEKLLSSTGCVMRTLHRPRLHAVPPKDSREY